VSLRLIRGAQVVAPEGIAQADVLLQGEWIIAVAPRLAAGGAEIIEAGGLCALPGGIDAHVHLRDPGATHKEDFTSGTRAALAGGVTTVLDMPNTPEPTTTASSFAAKVQLGESRACCDFGLYIGATAGNTTETASVEDAVGLKLYMGSTTGTLLVADLEGQRRHFEAYPATQPLAVHGEDEEAVRLFGDRERRPSVCAELAAGRAIALARRAGRRLHLCHISTRAELELVALAKRQGLPVTCEVTPHHLFLTKDDEEALGPLALMNPPLRGVEDAEALWAGLDSVDLVASDHAPHTLQEKHSDRPPPGVPGLETTLPLLLDAAITGRLALTEVARLTACAPAAVFSLPRKGRIAPGYHADIVLFDPTGSTLLGERPYTKCGWSPFAGRRTRGRIVRVILRGRDAAVEGKVVAEPGWGRFLAPSHA